MDGVASLGAAEQLAARTTAKFERLDSGREAAGRRRLRTALTTGLISTVTLTATAVSAIGTAPGPTTVVCVALITLGAPAQAEQPAAAAGPDASRRPHTADSPQPRRRTL